MGLPEPEQPILTAMDQILGYLNFSSGNHDSAFFSNLNLLFSVYSSDLVEAKPSRAADSLAASKVEQTAMKVHQQLKSRLEELTKSNDAFRDVEQAQAVLELTLGKLLSSYRKHHRDLLFHQCDELLFNSFFVGRAFEAVLQQGSPWDREKEIVNQAVSKLNDFIGHRPVAALESQKIEPYDHEWIRPIPVFIKGAGVAAGRYQSLIEHALEILQETDPHILRTANFDPEKLDELAIDPRAFDFDHPINKRPNHHFGQWDENWIDGSGFFRRFIIHQVTLDSLLERSNEIPANDTGGENGTNTRQEYLMEAAAVLAGTMLMAAGISGCGPGAYDSNTTLSDLLPVIAGYRDQFYKEWLRKFPAEHLARLESESETRRQPFGAVRQDLNARLAQRRASQLVNCRLASIFARMGYPEAAEKQSQIVPVAAARINCQIDCLLNAATQATERGELDEAFEAIPAAMRRLKRGIHCGAIVDPWNILGFDANYSLFPAVENSVRDHRVFDLVDMMDRIFAYCSRLWSEAAACDRLDMCAAIRKEFLSIVNWWRQFAAHEVMAVDAVDADDIFQAAELVAQALNLWHKGGAATGDIEFWAQHAEMFDSPKAYALVIDALMQRGDHKTSTALLVHWLSQADQIPLQVGDSSFHDLAFRWINEQQDLLRKQQPAPIPEQDENALEGIALDEEGLSDELSGESSSDASDEPSPRPAKPIAVQSPDKIWNRIRKFYDFIEANAEHYWSVPEFNYDRKGRAAEPDLHDPHGFDELDEVANEDDPEEKNIYGAAYDEVIYTDTTDDGVDGDVFGTSLTSDDALEAEVDRVLDRLEFLSTIASYWGVAATIPLSAVKKEDLTDKIRERLSNRRDIVRNWVRQASDNREKLAHLLKKVNSYPLPAGGSDHEAMLHYDQHRLYKDTMLDQTILTCIETENAVRVLLAVIRSIDFLLDDKSLARGSDESETPDELAEETNGTEPLVAVFAAILLRNPKLVSENFDRLTEHLHDQSLLYVPISKGGDPQAIVKARILQIAILDLMQHLPSIGLLVSTHELTKTALAMERNNPIGQGAVTEFDEIFEVAYSSMVHTLVQSTGQLKAQRRAEGELDEKKINAEARDVLFECIEMLTESMLILWLDHSRTLRLSVLEKVNDKNSWERLVEFIETYGNGFFTQHFLHLANIRAILHQGVDHWLTQVQQSPNLPDLRLFDELDKGIPRQKAVRYLTLVLESVIENYNEYRDYNTTTTQSDHGESLHSFLDFLRLRSRYDRVCWNLKPVIWAHRILVNDQENSVARMWRRSLTERVGPEATKYLDKLETLRNKYSMRMESVGRRLEGRFGHQMQIDRLKALVEPAMKDPHTKQSRRAFELLQHESQAFSRTTMGVGIDLPAWLAALENEVEQNDLPGSLRDPEFNQPLPETAIIPIAELREQLEELPSREPSSGSE